MALKLTLKPHERMILDGAVITNGDTKCTIMVENNVPILRQKDIITEKDANTPARRIYFAIQLMYIDRPNLTTYHTHYWKLVREFVEAAPSSLETIDRISEEIVNNNYYKALKLTQELINFEEEALRSVSQSATIVPKC